MRSSCGIAVASDCGWRGDFLRASPLVDGHMWLRRCCSCGACLLGGWSRNERRLTTWRMCVRRIY